MDHYGPNMQLGNLIVAEDKNGICFLQGPNCWEDVLTKGRMRGRCESNTDCQETTAVSKHVWR